ncbi:MAG: hypothetical protein M3R39_09705, partial [Actinomycetota bacterium]|nr:hypothetical protein [Actinomycetota bacterium]
MKTRQSLTSKLLVALLVATVLLCASAAPAFSLVDLAGNPVPNTATSSTSAQLAGSPTLLTKLADAASPADDDPLVLAQLGSPNSPEDDLAGALDALGAAATAGDAAAAAAARQLALDILEGNPIAKKAYSGIPLLNWNSPAKVKTVPAGGNVIVNVVRFGQHIVSDTWLLSFTDPSQPFTITYRVAVLSAAFGGQLTPTPLLADGGVPIGGLHSVLQPLALPGGLLTGTQESSRFHPAGANEGFRLGVQDVTVRMPPARFVTAILDPSLKRGREALATLEPATPARLAAAQAAFGFSGSAPTEAEKLAAIGVLGNAAPEKLLWTDLRALNPADPGFLPAAQALAAQDRQLVSAMRTRAQIPNGVVTDPAADASVVLLNNEAYVSRPSLPLPSGASLTVSVTNADGFAHTFQATDLKNRRSVFGPLDWGEFDWAPLPLGASPDLAPGASRTFTITPAASSFSLWLGDSEHGDQGGIALTLDRSARKQSLFFSPDFSMPLHETQDNQGNVWLTLPGVDKIGKLTPAADLHASTYEEYLLPNGAHTPNATVPPLGPHDVVVDSHGIVWVTLTLGNAIARIDPAQTVPDTTSGIRIYPLGPCNDGITFCRVVFPPNPLAPPTRQPLQMADLEDGRGNTVLWFTEAGANLIGVLRAAPDGTLLEQSDFPCGCTGPLGIGLDADGSVWFTEDFSNRIARLKPSQAQPFTAAPTLDHFKIPSSVAVFDREHPGGAVTAVPHSLALDRQGRVWFTEAATGKIGRLDPALAVPETTNGFTEFALPPNEFKGVAVPADLTIDRAGTVYWSDEYGDIIGTLTAAAGPGPPFRPQERRSLTDAPMVDAAGNLWFMEAGSNMITRISGVTAGLPAPAP